MDGSIARSAAIHDLLSTPLGSGSAARQALLAFDDHLLRRFGSLELVRLGPGDSIGVLRRRADEIWVLLDGSVDARLEDTRPSSPSLGATETLRFDSPHRFLVPFGVRLVVRAEAAATLLRLMTHTEGEDPPEAEGT